MTSTPSTRLRWSQLLFSQGFGTRRDCEALIYGGFVEHQGAVVEQDDFILAQDDLPFRVEGQAWVYRAQALLLLHKPAGYECSQRPSAWPGVLTLLPPPLRSRSKGGVQPIGRLDQDTTGLLLLTDDGALIHRVTHPKHHVPKVYEVQTAEPVTEAQLEWLRAGVVLNDAPQPVRAAACEATAERALRLTLTEGKYHQVKRMVAAVGNHVNGLHRSAFGSLSLDPETLPPGRWRWLSAEERAALLRRD